MSKMSWRRKIAIVMAVLMVLSVLLPGSGSTRDYEAEAAEAHDITGNLGVPEGSTASPVELFGEGSSTPKEVAWEISKENEYEMHVHFTEDSDSASSQFIMNEDDCSFTYTLPQGVNIQSLTDGGNLTIVVDGANEITGTTYSFDPNNPRVITGTFANDDILRSAPNVQFYLSFKVKFDEGLSELDFGNGVKIPVVYSDTPKVTAQKTGSYSTEDGKAHFEVTVDSTYTNNNVHVKDSLTGTAYKSGSLTIDSITMNGSSYAPASQSVTDMGFDVNLGTMTNGQKAVIRYSVDVDYEKLAADGTAAETENLVTVPTDENPDPDPVRYNLEHKIKYGSISKSGEKGTTDSDGVATVNYKVTYNDNCLAPMKGVTLTDKITDNYQTYSDPMSVTIKRYAKNGSLVSSQDVAVNVSADKKQWTYQLDDNDVYKYEITYSATVDTDDVPSLGQVSNTIEDNKGRKSGTSVTVGPDELHVVKEYTKVNFADREITWNVAVTVPEEGFQAGTTVTDTLPKQWITDHDAIEGLVAGSLSVIDDAGLTLQYSLTENDTNFVLTFANGVANPSGTEKTFVLEYKTKIDEDWYAASLNQSYLQDHTNRVRVVSGNRIGDGDSTVRVVPPTLKKTSKGKEDYAYASEYPVYRFDVVVGNPTFPLVIQDTFDPDLELVTVQQYTWDDKAPRVYVGNQFDQSQNPSGAESYVPAENITTGNGTFTITLDDSYQEAAHNYYRITYLLRIRDAAAYKRLAQKLADQMARDPSKKTWKLYNTVDVNGANQTVSFDFEDVPVEKSVDLSNVVDDGSGIDLYTATPKYTIVLNPLGLKLNNGKKMDATDTFSNLALQYGSINIQPDNLGITCDASGNVLTIMNIPDETPVTISYDSHISGDKDASGNITYSNTFELNGHSSTVTKTSKVKQEAAGTGSRYHIIVYKYLAGDLQTRIPGATFGLYDANKEPIQWNSGAHAGQNVEFTTGLGGNFTLSSDDVELYTNTKYYIKELKAPAGYVLKNTWYEFKIIKGTNPDYELFEYRNGDMMKIRNEKPGVTFTKVDQDDKPLAGAEFTLYSEDMTPLKTCISTEEGTVEFTDLTIAATGDTIFYIKETKAPSADYALDPTKYELSYSRDAEGNIVAKKNDLKDKSYKVKNTKGEYGTISVSKDLTVSGTSDPATIAKVKDQAFDVNLALTAPAGASIPGTLSAKISKTGSETRTVTVNMNQGVGTISLKAGETASISGLPAGTTAVVTETKDTSLETKGYTYDTVAVGNGYSRTITKNLGSSVVLWNGYTMPRTSLKVTKKWAEDSKFINQRPDSVEVQLKNGNTNVGEPVSLTAAENWTYIWSRLPKYDAELKEISYSVVETDGSIRELSARYTSGAPVEVQATTTDKAFEITNTARTGSLVVDKNFVIPAGTTVPASAYNGLQFQLKKQGTVIETFTYANIVRAKASGKDGYEIHELQLGDDYELVETNADGLLATYNLVLDEANSDLDLTGIKIEEGQETKADLTNTYVAMKGGIALKAYKTVDGDAPEAGGKYDGKFTFQLQETTAGTVPDRLSSVMSKTNVAGKVNFNAISYTAPAVHTYKITEAPVDASTYVNVDETQYLVTVTVTEDPSDRSKLEAEVTNVTKKAPDGTETTVDYGDGLGITFDNTVITTSLSVTKTVVSDIASDKDREFSFTVTLSDRSIRGTHGDMTFINGVAEFKLKDRETKVATDLPIGVDYTVEEDDELGFTSECPSSTGTTATAGNTVTFTNTRQTGDLVVKKTVDSDILRDHDKKFDFTVTLLNIALNGTFGEMTFTNGVATFSLKDGETCTATGLPVGDWYTVEEAEAAGFVTTYQNHNDNSVNPYGRIVEGQNGVTVTNTKRPSKIGWRETATKYVDGNRIVEGGPYDGRFTFTLTETTTGDVPDKLTAPQRKKNTGSTVIFDHVGYTQEGVHTYEFAEEPFEADDVEYDPTVYTATVEVTEEDGRLHTEWSWTKTTPEGTEPISPGMRYFIDFNNKTKKAVHYRLRAKKEAEGLKADNFGFRLERLNADGTADSTFTPVTARNAADGKVDFGVFFTSQKEETVYYHISETDVDETTSVSPEDGYYIRTVTTYDSNYGLYQVKLYRFAENATPGTGFPVETNWTEVTGGDPAEFTFENTSKMQIQKRDADGPLAGAVLEIYEGTEAQGTAVRSFTSGTTPVTVTELKYNTVYTLHEAQTPNQDYLEAEDIYFMIRPDGVYQLADATDTEGTKVNNGLLTMIDTKRGEALPKEISAELTKSHEDIYGEAVQLTAGEYAFSMTALSYGGVLDQDATRVPKTVKNAADGTVTFGPLTYLSTDAGKTYAYLVKETDPAADTASMDMDETQYILVVTVDKVIGTDTDYELVLAKQWYKAPTGTEADIQLENRVDEADVKLVNKDRSGILKITKTIKGDVTPEEAAGQLQFTVTDENGKVLVIKDGTTEKRLEKLILDKDFTKAGDVYELEIKVPAGQKYIVSEVIYDVDGAVLTQVTGNGVALEKKDGIYSMTTDTVQPGTTPTAADYENTYKKGKLVITKTIKGDVTPEEAAGQLEFTITNETTGEQEVVNLSEFKFDKETGIYTYEIDAKPGDVYSVTETDYDVDGAILETVTHKVMGAEVEEGATADGIVISSTEQTRVDFEDDYKDDEGVIHFSKFGYSSELCSATPDATAELAGVTFRAEKTDDATVYADATSDSKGQVVFKKLPAGTYKVYEIDAPENVILDKTVYYAVIRNASFEGLTDKDGKKIEKGRIINDVYRADIEFTKVSELDTDETLAGSTYYLYKEAKDGSTVKVAEASTDANGKIVFRGVLTDVKYTVKEVISPDGYYVSENPITIGFKVEEDESGKKKVVVDEDVFNDGDKTVVVDKDGNITWLEPEVVVSVSKVDQNGAFVSGATLRIEDLDGNVVIPEWVTTGEAYTIKGKLAAGQSYRLVEVKAPDGYEVAGAITFKIPDDQVKAGETKAVEIKMIDKKTTPPDTPKTDDDTPLLPVAGLMALSLAGAVVVGSVKKKMKKNKKKK